MKYTLSLRALCHPLDYFARNYYTEQFYKRLVSEFARTPSDNRDIAKNSKGVSKEKRGRDISVICICDMHNMQREISFFINLHFSYAIYIEKLDIDISM